VRKRRIYPLLGLVAGVCIWLAGASPRVVGQAGALSITDRILLTLANSIGREARYGSGDLPEIRNRPDFMIDEESGGEGQGGGAYAYSFRSQEGSFSGSGYFKIASPARSRETRPEEGWQALPADETTGAAVLFRKVRRSEVVAYNEVEVTAAKGSFVLTVSLRRPPGEASDAAREAAREAFSRLLENARKYGLLFRIQLEFLDDRSGEPLEEDALLNVRGAPDEETTVRLRLRAVDSKGAALPNVKAYLIKLKGALGPLARLEGASFNSAKGQYEIQDPPAEGPVVSVVFPGLRSRDFASALERDAGLRRGFGIVLNVEATFKDLKEEKEP
jgi:hypothetical protein